jgi:hypothetical protein
VKVDGPYKVDSSEKGHWCMVWWWDEIRQQWCGCGMVTRHNDCTCCITIIFPISTLSNFLISALAYQGWERTTQPHVFANGLHVFSLFPPMLLCFKPPMTKMTPASHPPHTVHTFSFWQIIWHWYLLFTWQPPVTLLVAVCTSEDAPGALVDRKGKLVMHTHMPISHLEHEGEIMLLIK